MKNLSLTTEMIAALLARFIQFYPAARRGILAANPTIAFEASTQHPRGCFMPLGAHSYSQSAFRVASIGRYCSIAPNVRSFGAAHPTDWLSSSPFFYNGRRRSRSGMDGITTPGFSATPKPIHIGNDVWIGADVTLRDGIKIGDGAVVASGALVTKDVAPYTIVGGNPARVLRQRFPQEIADELLRLQWWKYDPNALLRHDVRSPTAFIKTFSAETEVPLAPEMRRDAFQHIEDGYAVLASQVMKSAATEP